MAAAHSDHPVLRVVHPNIRVNAYRAAARSIKIPQTFSGVRFLAAHRSLLTPSEPMVQELVQTIYRRGGIILALDTAMMFRTSSNGRDSATVHPRRRLQVAPS